jgi:hypothetical protein
MLPLLPLVSYPDMVPLVRDINRYTGMFLLKDDLGPKILDVSGNDYPAASVANGTQDNTIINIGNEID